MILIGQYDSPFVRRVGIALTLYGMAFEHRPFSTFADAGEIRPYNPLCRVPTLILNDGRVLIESAYILDWLDEGAGPGKALIAASGAMRQKALYLIALSTGLADKAVSLFYERALHDITSDKWTQRLKDQISAVLETLERERLMAGTQWLLGEQMGHADIALGCALRFASDALKDQINWDQCPALKSHSDMCEATAVFQSVYQAFADPGTTSDS